LHKPSNNNRHTTSKTCTRNISEHYIFLVPQPKLQGL